MVRQLKTEHPTRDEANMSDLSVSPLASGFGVRIGGAALESLPQRPDVAATLRGLIARHRAVVLTDLHIDANQLVALAGTLGSLRPARVRHPGLPLPAGEYLFVGSRDASSHYVVPAPADAAHRWHVDYTFANPIPRLSMLHVVQAPAHGSRSGFADMGAVYRALPQSLKDRIEGLVAQHYQHPHGVDLRLSGEDIAVPWADRAKGVAQPLVLRDVEGQPSLCLPSRCDSPVVGLNEDESCALLDELWRYVEPFGDPWEYEQASGELLVWNNRALLHKRSAWPADEARLTWFITAN